MAKDDPKFQELLDLVAMGLTITQVRELMAAGFSGEQIADLADAQQQARLAADQRTADAIQQGTSNAIAANKPRRTSREDADYERISVYNPLGDRDHPRPGLKCEMWWGVLHPKDPLNKAPGALYPIEADSCTVDEQIALNRLEPLRTSIERNDGERMPVHVVPTFDSLGQSVTRLMIAVPKQMYEREFRNQMPPLKRLAELLAPKAA